MTAPTRATVIRRASGSAGGAASADKHWFHCQDKLVQWKSQTKLVCTKKIINVYFKTIFIQALSSLS